MDWIYEKVGSSHGGSSGRRAGYDCRIERITQEPLGEKIRGGGLHMLSCTGAVIVRCSSTIRAFSILTAHSLEKMRQARTESTWQDYTAC